MACKDLKELKHRGYDLLQDAYKYSKKISKSCIDVQNILDRVISQLDEAKERNMFHCDSTLELYQIVKPLTDGLSGVINEGEGIIQDINDI